jgi:hypothetical protein
LDKTRTIQDCLGWAFEYIHQCQQCKKEIVIIKLDFTKAFDMIEHSAITQMMHQLGFNDKWISWTVVDAFIGKRYQRRPKQAAHQE